MRTMFLSMMISISQRTNKLSIKEMKNYINLKESWTMKIMSLIWFLRPRVCIDRLIGILKTLNLVLNLWWISPIMEELWWYRRKEKISVYWVLHMSFQAGDRVLLVMWVMLDYMKSIWGSHMIFCRTFYMRLSWIEGIWGVIWIFNALGCILMRKGRN